MHHAALGIYYCAFISNTPLCVLLLPCCMLLQPRCLLQHTATLCCSCHQLPGLSCTSLTQGSLIRRRYAAVSATFAHYTPPSLEYRTPPRVMVGALVACSILPTAVCLLPKPLVRVEQFKPPTQGLCTARCIQYGLLTGRCIAHHLIFIIAPPSATCHITRSFCHIAHSFSHVACCSVLLRCAAAAISFRSYGALCSPKDRSYAANMLL